MNEVVEKRLEFLKLEDNGFSLCEIVKAQAKNTKPQRETSTTTLKPATPGNVVTSNASIFGNVIIRFQLGRSPNQIQTKRGSKCLVGQSTFWCRCVKWLLVGLSSLRVLPTLTRTQTDPILGIILPVNLYLCFLIKGFLSYFLYYEV